MADIEKELNDIKNAVYGREVRSSIHDGIKKINDESEESKQKAEEAHEITQDLLDETFDSAALEANFEQRLNDEITNLQPEWTGFKNDVTAQLASIEERKADKEEVDQLSSQLAQTVNDINMYGAIAHLHGVVGDYDPVTKTGSDVTQKLQKLINDYPVVYLFGGNYLITDTIDIPSDRLIYGFNADVYFDINSPDRKHNITITNKHDVEIKGINFHTLPSSSTSHMLNITDSENVNIHNNLFDGGSIYQNESFTGGANGGIYVFEGNENVLIEQNVVKNMRTGHGIQTGNSKVVVIKENTISYTARAGVSINSGTENCTVKGNIISYSQMDFTFDGAIDIYGYAPICKNILIEGNKISNIGNDTIAFSKENCIIRIKDVDGVIVRHNKITIDRSIYAIFMLQHRELYQDGGRLDNVTIFDNEIEIFATFNHICRVRADYLVENFKFNHNKFKSRHVLVGEEAFGFADIRVLADTSNTEICYNNFDFENEIYGESNNLIINMKGVNYEHNIVKIAGNTCNTRKRFVEIVNGKRVIISSNIINSRVGGSMIKVDDGTVVLVDGNVVNSFTATNKVDVTGTWVKDDNNLVTDSFY